MVRPLGETDAAWVPDYFGDEYLRLYQFPPERTAPEVAFLEHELRELIPDNGDILDLACGQCRHGLPLAKKGFHVTGLDYQENLLQEATRVAREQEITISLVQGDMRQLPFANSSFDAVLNLFTAFGYFSDAENAHVLEEVARVLRPGGVFIIDVTNRDALLRQAQPRSWKRLPDQSLVISEWKWDVPTGRYTHWQLVLRGQQQREFQHSVRVYTCTELGTMLKNAGLTPAVWYGNFQGESLTLEAPRMIGVARK